MIDNSWVLDIEPSIFTIIKMRSLEKIKAQFPEVTGENFTMDNVVRTDAVFPTIYIHFLGGVEVGADLEGQDINGIMCSVQVEITVLDSMGLNGARYISSVLINEFKKLRFKVNSLPEFSGNTADTKRIIFRARRVIGASDIIN